jgi:membrane fusion protein, multidrug efflux system
LRRDHDIPCHPRRQRLKAPPGAPVRNRSLFGLWSLLPAIALALATCKPAEKPAVAVLRPVRTITVAKRETREPVVLTGHIQAQDEVALAFRIGGRMIERAVNVGDRVEAGQVIAKLDPENEMNDQRSAQAALKAAQAKLNYARNHYDRQQQLLRNGHTTRARYDQAQKALQSAQAAVTNAKAQLQIAKDRVSYTTLRADGAGTVTARGAEPGEVVQAGQMIVRLARQGGLDAAFDVPAQVLRAAAPGSEISVRLADDPAVTATGRVREIAPQADPVTRTFEVKVALNQPPPEMRLGATVIGSVTAQSAPAIEIPASALTQFNRQPAVWIVDPKNHTVFLRNIELARHDPEAVVVAQGLATGDIVVTAGVQALHPGEKVRLLGSPS